jgi:serine protease
MEAKTVSFVLLLSLSALLSVGCPEAPLPPSGTSSLSESPGRDDSGLLAPTDPSTAASISGHLIVQQVSFQAAVLEKQVADSAAATAQPDNVIPGELVVRFDETVTDAERARILAAHGMREIERSPSGYCRVACPSRSAVDPRQAKLNTLDDADLLLGQPGVRRAVPSRRRYIARVPNDKYFPLQWHYSMINLPEAWDFVTGSDDVVVAVIDTGILSGHPDLSGRLVPGYDFVSDPDSARDGDGRDPDAEDPGDELDGPGHSSFHGTHVAGVIGAASDNGVGGAGVTWHGKIMPVRALGKDGGSSFDVAEAIRFAAGLPNVSGTVPAKPARIINLSVSGLPGEPAAPEEADAVNAAVNAGVLVIAAAGNQGSSQPTWPAAQTGVMSIGAVDMLGARASYSNYGSTLDLVAPGGVVGVDANHDGYGDGILSTCGSDSTGAVVFNYIFYNGTSMAAPHVAGVAALVMAANPSLTAAQARSILENTAQDLGAPGRDDEFGFGLVDAAAAVREALHQGGAGAGSAPILSLTTTTLDFSDDLNVFRVRVNNAGGGFVTISSVAVQDDGGGWLRAETSGSTASSSVQDIVIRVTRSSLAEGVYHGTVTVNADGLAPGVIQVSMTVGPAPGAGEQIYVLAFQPGEATPVAQTRTSAGANYAYRLSGLPAGNYMIYAGTDRDGDGFICDLGDLCGAIPALSAPTTLSLGAGQQLTNMDFPIEDLQAGDGRAQPLHLPLMP